MKNWFFVSATILFTAGFTALAGSTNAVYWDFSNGAAPTLNPFSDLTVSDVSGGNAGGGTFLNNSSPSSGYTNAADFIASGGTNASVSAEAGALDTSSSTFFSLALSLDPLAAYSLVITDISLGSRSTGTGPSSLSLYASTDGFTSDFESLGDVLVSTDKNWAAVQFASLSLNINAGETLSLRLYGSGGTSTAANWRIDDLAIEMTPVSANPAPEPSAFILATLGGLIGLVILRRKI